MSDFDSPYDNMLRMQAFEKAQKTKHQVAAILGNMFAEQEFNKPWFPPASLERGKLSLPVDHPFKRDLIPAVGLVKCTDIPVSVIGNIKTDTDVLDDLIKKKIIDSIYTGFKPRYDYEVSCEKTKDLHIEPRIGTVTDYDVENKTITVDDKFVLKYDRYRFLSDND